MKIRKYLAILTFLLCYILGFTQQSSTNIVTDKVFYTHGEIVHGFIGFAGVQVQNKYINVAVISSNTKLVVQEFFIIVNNNVGEFYLPLVSSFLPGTYQIVFSTVVSVDLVQNKSMKIIENSEFALVNIGSINFNLINRRLNSGIDEKYYIKTNNNCCENLVSKEVIRIQAQDSFNLNQFITAKSHYKLISVDDGEQFFTKKLCNVESSEHNLGQDFFNSFSEKIFYILDVKGENGKKKFNLLGLYSKENDQIFLGKSNEYGIVFFFVNNFFGSRNFQLLFSKSETELLDYDVVINKNVINDHLVLADSIELRKIFANIKMRRKVHSHFNIEHLKFLSMSEKTDFEYKYEHQKLFQIKNYKKFPDIVSFCRENTIPLKFELINGKYKVTLSPPLKYTNGQNEKWINPVFLMDGEVIFDLKSVVDFPMMEIVDIKLFYDKKVTKQWMSAFGNNGIVQLTTKRNINELKEKKLSVNGLQREKVPINNLIGKTSLLGLPEISATLFWKVDPKIDKINLTLRNNSDNSDKYLYLYFFDNLTLKRDIQKLVFDN